MSTPRWWLLCGAGCVVPASASGFDAQVQADTIAQSYQVRGPAGSPVISSQLVTQTASLSVVQRPHNRRGIVVSFQLRLRLDADFGGACNAVTGQCLDETNPMHPSEFAPLFHQRAADLEYAYLDVSNIGHGALDVRLGRMMQVDALGFFVFDGVRSRVHVGDYVVAEALGGLETRAGFLLSDGRFERDGLIRADRSGWDQALAPFVLQETFAPVVGVALETAFVQPVFARVTYRRVWTQDGISEEKLGATIDARILPQMRVFGDAVFSLPEQVLSVAMLTAELRAHSGARIDISYQRYRPTFDLNSIWASFWVDATDEGHIEAQLPLTQRVVATGEWFVRRFALSETGPSTNGAPVNDMWNTGGNAALRIVAPAYQGNLRAHVEGGDVGARAGVDADGFWWCAPPWIRLDARLSLWHVDDDLRPYRSGFSWGGVIGTTIRLARIADVHIDGEDDINPQVGQRFKVMARLTLRGML